MHPRFLDLFPIDATGFTPPSSLCNFGVDVEKTGNSTTRKQGQRGVSRYTVNCKLCVSDPSNSRTFDSLSLPLSRSSTFPSSSTRAANFDSRLPSQLHTHPATTFHQPDLAGPIPTRATLIFSTPLVHPARKKIANTSPANWEVTASPPPSSMFSRGFSRLLLGMAPEYFSNQPPSPFPITVIAYINIPDIQAREYLYLYPSSICIGLRFHSNNL